MAQLLEDFYETKMRYREVDRLVWTPLQKQGFQVKSYYSFLRGFIDFPWRSIKEVCIL